MSAPMMPPRQSPRRRKSTERQNLADYIRLAPVADLVPYARNSRKHSPEQIEQIVASMREFGFTNPILERGNGGLIAGHGRALAAAEIYRQGGTISLPGGKGPLPAGMVPVISAAGWSEAQISAYVIADNRLAENAEWDEDILRLELGMLGEAGFDLELLGFDDELDGILNAPEPAAESGPGLAERFGIPPFSVMNARGGWWQERKAAWLALGIMSELGRGDTEVNSPHEGHGMADGLVAVRAKEKRQRKANATPGGSTMPAADYSKRQRGDGKGRAMKAAATDA